MVEKVTMMKLKVDLQCRKCFKKIKKVFCKFPQIRDQLYDEKNGTVTLRVVCCSPEKVRDSLCCEGGGSIKSIEILEPPKPKPPPEKPRPPPEKPKEPEKKPNPSPRSTVATPAAKFPEPVPISALAYPLPVVSVGPFYGSEPMGFYGRPIYDSYGWSGPCYADPHHEYLSEDETPVCSII